MKKIIEVIAHGFNAETDETDDRVLWVYARSVESLAEKLNKWNVPHIAITETDLDPEQVSREEILDEKHDIAELVASLYGFALDDCRAALVVAERFIVGFEGDETQDGIDELLAQVRAAAGIEQDDEEKAQFVAGWNMLGYMPDNPSEEFATFDDAKRYIIAELKNAEDNADTEEEAETICAFAEDVNLQSAPFGATCGNYHYFVSEV